MKNKRDEKHVRIKAVIITCFLMMSVMTVGGCSGTKDNTVSDTTTSEAAGGLELSDYVGMTEDEFLTETGFEKNDFGMYPDINHAAVICMDGLVNSLMINEYNSENTFKGYSVGGSLDELDGLISAYNLVDTSEIEGGTRNTYMNSGYDAALAVDVDDQSKVFGISYVILSDDTAGSDTEVDDSNTGLENVSKELKVLEENGFDTSILTTEEQVIVSYAKFVAVSSVSGDGITPTRTMDDIISEIFEYGFASDLSDYNSYGILNYYIDCEIYKGITTTAAEIIDEQYDIGDGWAAMDQQVAQQMAAQAQTVYAQQPQVVIQQAAPQQVYVSGINPTWPVKNKVAAGILGIFLGGIGAHKFYLGKVGMGILYLCFCWTGIPAIVGFVEGIIYLCSNDENFQLKNHVRIEKPCKD